MAHFPRLPRTFSRHFLSVRVRFLLVALLISLSFLSLQFYVLHSATTKAPPARFATPSAAAAPPSPPLSTVRPVAQKYAILGVVKRFVELMTFLEAPVFIVDPAILEHLLVLNGNPNSRCKFFCQVPHGLVTFGVAANFWPDRTSTYPVRARIEVAAVLLLLFLFLLVLLL